MQQRIDELRDRLRTGLNVGKWQARLIKLKYERSRHDKDRRQALTALGAQAWEQSIEHANYAATFEQLRDLDQQRSALRTAISALEDDIRQQEEQLQQMEAGFQVRIQDAEARKHTAVAELARLAGAGQDPAAARPAAQFSANATVVLDQTEAAESAPERTPRLSTDTTMLVAQPDAVDSSTAQGPHASPHATVLLDESATTPFAAQQDPSLEQSQHAMQANIAQYEQQINALQAELQQESVQRQAAIQQLNQDIKSKGHEIANLEEQFAALHYQAGEQIEQVRPIHNALTPHYARLDGINQEMAQLTSEIETLNQQIGAAGSGAMQTLYWMAGGALLAVLALLLLVPMMAGGAFNLFGGSGVSERQMREDLVGMLLRDQFGFLYSNIIWEIQADDIRKFQILERRTDLEAGTDSLLIYIELSDDIVTVSSEVEMAYQQYSQGWMLQDDPDARDSLHVVKARNQPDPARLEADIRDNYYDSRRTMSCPRNQLRSVTVDVVYGGSYEGQSLLGYEVTASYATRESSAPGQLQAPDFCSDGTWTWHVFYNWVGNDWQLEDVIASSKPLQSAPVAASRR